tara:strand:- start:439 stop:819 length:381 start_codon:yes stop_codon:yes gene_type:complete
MDSIRAIQECIDTHKEDLPTGFVTEAMKLCQKANNNIPTELYRICYKFITANTHEERSVIVEECPNDDMAPKNWRQAMIIGRMPATFYDHHNTPGSLIAEGANGEYLQVFLRVEKFSSYKRKREDA